ncbi:hypothetical protein Droror1_Dr00027524 [Drosera rotundifolia]
MSVGEVLPEKKQGCGLLNAFFGGRSKLWPRRSSSASNLSSQNGSMNDDSNKYNSAPTPISKQRKRGSSGDGASFAKVGDKQAALNKTGNDVRITTNQPKAASAHKNNVMVQGRRAQPPSPREFAFPRPMANTQAQAKKVPKEVMGISGELESMIAEHHRAKGGNANLVRASSGNVMLFSHLGNLRSQPDTGDGMGNVCTSLNTDSNRNNKNRTNTGKYENSTMGNVVKKKNEQEKETKAEANPLCRALSCRMDPEGLKIMGNEDYKNGRFAEALALYERAIDLDPDKASYRSNKSAALSALGRLLEAVFECRAAIRIEPHYHRAHHRLANLYLRLGEAEKAMFHVKQSGPEADPDALAKAKVVLGHLRKCDEAKRSRDWNSVLKETGNAISAGADSAPMMFALQAEAFLKLHKHEEADTTLSKGPQFDVDQCTKYFGPVGNTALLVIRAQVDVAAGRFDDALEVVQQAARLDPSNREVGLVSRRARAVAAARSQGNELFKVSKFSEASVAYRQGLDHDPHNSILLCNRAACWSKLCQYDKAIEDCSTALNVRPSYSKARLRRADCNFKLGKWEAAIQDYEMLLRGSPGDEAIGRGLFEAQVQLRKQRGEDFGNMKFGDNDVIVIEGKDQFRHHTSLPGLQVALFCNKTADRETLKLLVRLCKRYPTIKFLKVQVEDNDAVTKSEGVTSFPVFSIYKNGSKVKEVLSEEHTLLESLILDCIN